MKIERVKCDGNFFFSRVAKRKARYARKWTGEIPWAEGEVERLRRITASLKFLILVYDATENHICGRLAYAGHSALGDANNVDIGATFRMEAAISPVYFFLFSLFFPRVDKTLIALAVHIRDFVLDSSKKRS